MVTPPTTTAVEELIEAWTDAAKVRAFLATHKFHWCTARS